MFSLLSLCISTACSWLVLDQKGILCSRCIVKKKKERRTCLVKKKMFLCRKSFNLKFSPLKRPLPFLKPVNFWALKQHEDQTLSAKHLLLHCFCSGEKAPTPPAGRRSAETLKNVVHPLLHSALKPTRDYILRGQVKIQIRIHPDCSTASEIWCVQYLWGD